MSFMGAMSRKSILLTISQRERPADRWYRRIDVPMVGVFVVTRRMVARWTPSERRRKTRRTRRRTSESSGFYTSVGRLSGPQGLWFAALTPFRNRCYRDLCLLQRLHASPTGWFTRRVPISSSTPITRLTGTPGERRRLTPHGGGIAPSCCPSGIPRATGVMSWNVNRLKTNRSQI